jgi:hypothetical protein
MLTFNSLQFPDSGRNRSSQRVHAEVQLLDVGQSKELCRNRPIEATAPQIQVF